jgi:hypothetical protein
MACNSRRACMCGHQYDAEGWAALALLTRLTAPDVSSLLTKWPPNATVEVRACAHCRRQMARLDQAEQGMTHAAAA